MRPAVSADRSNLAGAGEQLPTGKQPEVDAHVTTRPALAEYDDGTRRGADVITDVEPTGGRAIHHFMEATGIAIPAPAVVAGMKAITYSTYGNPDVLELGDQPMPKVGPGMVLIKVKTAAVNPVDFSTPDMRTTPWLLAHCHAGKCPWTVTTSR